MKFNWLAAIVVLNSSCGGSGVESKSSTRGPRDSAIEVVSRLQVAPGNLSLGADGTILASLHQFYAPQQHYGYLRDGEWHWQKSQWVDAALGVNLDSEGTTWLLDNGLRSGSPPQLVSIAAGSQELNALSLAPALSDGAFVNDLVVDLPNQAVYIADTAEGERAALIVVDLKTRQMRRVLEGHKSMVAEDLDLIIDGRAVEIAGSEGKRFRPRIGVNPIAADAAMEWLYYGPMHSRSMYRIRAVDLRDASLSKEELAARVERFGDKVICDGIAVDNDGNIYMGDLAENAIGVLDAKGTYRVLHRDERLRWVDAFSFGPDGYLYAVVNQLHRSAPLNGGTDDSKAPYLIVRFRPLAPGPVGR